MSEDSANQIDESQTTPPEAGAVVGGMIERLFDHWQLPDHDRAALLGVSAQQPKVGDFVASNEATERMGQLLAIHAKLRTLFPQDRIVAYSWMTTPNRAFEGLTPLAVVREYGLEGLRAVRAYLERAIGR